MHNQSVTDSKLTSLELCAGAGGQALGVHLAGFEPMALVEVDQRACETLRHNRPGWNVIEEDLNSFDAKPFEGVDLIAAGLPCPPFSIAGRMLGSKDERNLFPALFRIVEEAKPKALMIENVKGFLSDNFSEYRTNIELELIRLGYGINWKLLDSSDYGVSQSRKRAIGVALPFHNIMNFKWPEKVDVIPLSVGDKLRDLISANGWRGAEQWAKNADEFAPTIVGGSKKHGGPDLGPTGAKKAWAKLGVNGKGIADEAPSVDFTGMPKLTVGMVARLQGFPDDWEFIGRKTHTYRQVGNAFPPPVAAAVAKQIYDVLVGARTSAEIAA